MYLKYHFVFTLVFCIILFPFLNWWTIIVFLSGFFIDVDHYLYYIIKFKDWNLKKAYKIHFKKKYKDKLHIFHTIEFYLLIVSLNLLYPFFSYILIGVSFHLILDTIDVLLERMYIARIIVAKPK